MVFILTSGQVLAQNRHAGTKHSSSHGGVIQVAEAVLIKAEAIKIPVPVIITAGIKETSQLAVKNTSAFYRQYIITNYYTAG